MIPEETLKKLEDLEAKVVPGIWILKEPQSSDGELVIELLKNAKDLIQEIRRLRGALEGIAQPSKHCCENCPWSTVQKIAREALGK